MATFAGSKKILAVLTNSCTLGESAHITGAYLSEITHAYDEFIKAGYDVDMVSPRGGKVPLDGLKMKDVLNSKWMHDSHFLKKIEHTLRPWDVKSEDYDAIYFVGGHGAVFDLPENKHIQKLTSEIFENEGLVAAICHGVSGIMNVKLSDGQYLVKGHELTCFSNEEEKLSGYDRDVPFHLQSELQERGAVVSATAPFENHVVISGRLVTGQNSASSTELAKKMIEILHQIAQGHYLPEKVWCEIKEKSKSSSYWKQP